MDAGRAAGQGKGRACCIGLATATGHGAGDFGNARHARGAAG